MGEYDGKEVDSGDSVGCELDSMVVDEAVDGTEVAAVHSLSTVREQASADSHAIAVWRQASPPMHLTETEEAPLETSVELRHASSPTQRNRHG